MGMKFVSIILQGYENSKSNFFIGYKTISLEKIWITSSIKD